VALLPKVDFSLLRHSGGVTSISGMISFVVLRPYTRFGKPKAAVQDKEEIKTMR